MPKKKPDFSCFYEFIICKKCDALHYCIPSFDGKKLWLNVPKNCTECKNKLVPAKRWEKMGYHINQGNNKEIKGKRLLLDLGFTNLKINAFSDPKARLEEVLGKKFTKKLYKQLSRVSD